MVEGRRWLRATRAAVRPKPDDGGQKQDGEDHGQTREVRTDSCPMCAQSVSEIRENIDPRYGADSRVKQKATKLHSRDACGKRNECAQYGEQSGDQCRDAAITAKVVFGRSKVFFREEDVLPVAVKK